MSEPPRAGEGSRRLETSLLGPLMVPAGTISAEDLADLSRRAAVYATRARGEGTRRAYRAAWSVFSAWCASSRPQSSGRRSRHHRHVPGAPRR